MGKGGRAAGSSGSKPTAAPSISSDMSEYTQKSEMLLVGCASADPFSTIVIDPKTGVSAWSYKGSELQGNASGLVAPLGVSGEHLLVSLKDRPLVHCLAVHNKDRFHAKTVLTGPVASFCTSRDGTLLFAAINTQIYIWLLTTGEMLSVTDAHYQQISKIGLSDDGSILVSASNDGAVHVYLVSDLVSVDRDRNVSPLRKWRAHTLAVRGLSVSHGREPRVATCGLDHIASVHSISLDSCLLKVSADRPLTACALDPAESRFFIGSDVGNIAQINLYDVGTNIDMLVQTADERNSAVPVFNGHSEEISVLAVSGDGALLASGDASGKYCLWEISSRQCVRVSSMRGPISSLSFIPNWPTLSSHEYATVWRPVFDLQRNPTTGAKTQLIVRKKDDKNWTKFKKMTDSRLEMAEISISKKAKKVVEPVEEKKMEANGQPAGKKEEEVVVVEKKKAESSKVEEKEKPTGASNAEADARIKELEAEVAKLKRINAELYDFGAKQILKDIK